RQRHRSPSGQPSGRSVSPSAISAGVGEEGLTEPAAATPGRILDPTEGGGRPPCNPGIHVIECQDKHRDCFSVPEHPEGVGCPHPETGIRITERVFKFWQG